MSGPKYKRELKRHLPAVNVPWSAANSKGANDYLETQRQRDLSAGH